jgi:hypothetical protein
MGNRFELVVLGILNEEEQLARQATLYRDVRTWKDLEIAKLGELRKVRIQVKFLANIEQNDMEIARSRWSPRTVVISPVEIARFIERKCEAAVAPWTWREFLESLPHKVHDLQDLASMIYELFYSPWNATRMARTSRWPVCLLCFGVWCGRMCGKELAKSIEHRGRRRSNLLTADVRGRGGVRVRERRRPLRSGFPRRESCTGFSLRKWERRGVFLLNLLKLSRSGLLKEKSLGVLGSR